MTEPAALLTLEVAAARARDAIARFRGVPGGAVLLESGVVERPTVFAFRWTSRRFQETGDRRQAPVGATHVLVDRRDGTTSVLDAHGSPDAALERWERLRGVRPPGV